MINNSSQNWEIGKVVKIGFMSLRVRDVTPNLEDGLPYAYILTNLTGTQLYRFTPHYGVTKIDVTEARRMLEFKARCEEVQALNIAAVAAKAAEINALFA